MGRQISITIVNYDAGNLRNVQKAVEAMGHTAAPSSIATDIESADALILPGVGSFHDGMANLERLGLADGLRKAVQEQGKPILGICLGMQLFAEEGSEGGHTQGLGLLPMTVEPLSSSQHGLRVPHIGWDDVSIQNNPLMFRGLPENPDFYFVHSYHAVCQDRAILAATCDYGHTFTAAAERDHIWATQFHPEKSQRYGMQVLRNFLDFVV